MTSLQGGGGGQLNGPRRVKVFFDKILIFISVKEIGPL